MKVNINSEYLTVRSHLHDVALKLMKWEKKTWVKASISEDGYSILQLNNQKFYLVETNTFRQITNSILVQSAIRYPHFFGKKNAIPILDAIHKYDNVFLKLNESIKFYSEENFCYVVQVNEDQSIGKTLRIDLFRKLRGINGTKSHDFVGGILHCFKHFSINNQVVGIEKRAFQIEDVNELLIQIIRTFYFPDWTTQKANNRKYLTHKSSFVKYGKDFIASFYYEPNCDIYFLNTAFVK